MISNTPCSSLIFFNYEKLMSVNLGHDSHNIWEHSGSLLNSACARAMESRSRSENWTPTLEHNIYMTSSDYKLMF